MLSFDYSLNPLYPIKECSSCGALYTTDYCCSEGSLMDKIICDPDKTPDLFQEPPQNCPKCKCPIDGHYCQGYSSEPSNDNTNVVNALQEPFVVKQDPGKNSSQSPPQINHHCCYGCGNSLEDIFCHQCTCELCRKGAHYGYNCPSKVPIVPNHEPFNNQTVDELPQTLPSFDPACYSEDVNLFTYDSESNHVHDSPKIFDPPPQPPVYSCEFYENDARYGHYCTPQVPFIYLEPCYNQDFNFPQNYYHEKNSCYDPNSFGFDQFQPPQYTVNHPIFKAQNKLMEQLTSMCDMVGQYIQKKEEENQIEEEQATKARYWKIPVCYDDDDDDDDEDYAIAITPILSTDVKNLVSIPSESEGIPDNMCDVPFHDNSSPLDVSKDQFEDFSDSNDDSTLIDDDSFSIDNIKYVEASPPDSELVSSEVIEIVILEVGGIDDDILLTIKDDILREKLLNINLLIANIEALKDNPTPSSDFMTKSSSTSLNFLLEETNTFDNSLPESKTFCFDLEEISSGSTTTRSDISLPEYEAFYDDHVKEISSGSTTTYSKSSLYDSFIFDLLINPIPPADRSDFYHEEFTDKLDHIISPPEYDCFCFKNEPNCFCFKNEPNSRDFTMDVVEDIFPTRELRLYVHNVLPTHPTL
nr:hypothetical protein [Tanacetum cinerariifolium]